MRDEIQDVRYSATTGPLSNQRERESELRGLLNDLQRRRRKVLRQLTNELSANDFALFGLGRSHRDLSIQIASDIEALRVARDKLAFLRDQAENTREALDEIDIYN